MTTSGVAHMLGRAVDAASVRPLWAVGYVVGNVAASVLLLVLGRRLTRPFR